MRNENLQERMPSFQHEQFSWFVELDLQKYIKIEQESNKPALNNIACFIVTSDKDPVYVLIDDDQNVLAEYNYNLEGYMQMEAMIDILKVAKHFDDADI